MTKKQLKISSRQLHSTRSTESQLNRSAFKQRFSLFTIRKRVCARMQRYSRIILQVVFKFFPFPLFICVFGFNDCCSVCTTESFLMNRAVIYKICRPSSTAKVKIQILETRTFLVFVNICCVHCTEQRRQTHNIRRQNTFDYIVSL